MNRIKKFINAHFITDELTFESRILNFVCFFGAVASAAALVARIISGLPFITMAPLLLMIVAICGVFLISVLRPKNASFLTALIVSGVSIVFWPILFFTIGGPGSGMAVYFALALILDFTLLKGMTRVIAILVTIAVTIVCYVSTLFWGWGVLPEGGLNTFQLFIDIMQSILIVGFLMGIIILYETRLYQNERNKVEAAIGQRNESLSQLKSAQNTVSAMFESNPHINILFDASFKIVDCNPAAVEFMGFDSKEEMLAGFQERLLKTIPKVLTTGRQTTSPANWFMDAVKEGFIKRETEFVFGDDVRNVDIELKKIPYGDSYAIVGYIYDMTEIRAREMELKLRDKMLSEAVEDAKAANQAKSAFLSNMSHEIRTPMNAVLGITEIQLQKETLDQDVRDALGKIYVSGDMLLGIINDILDLSKIEAGKLELLIDRYEIASLVSDTAQLNMMRIGSKPIEFELNIDENMPSTVSGDELRVKQILNNVLSNAFKYTSVGTVKLSLTAEPCDMAGNGDISLVATISDTGQGMTKEQIERIFDEYSRFNMEANRTTEGTGLGMSITRNLVRLMNGTVSVESEPGKGSTFTIRIPQSKVGSDVLGREVAENLRQFRSRSRTQMKRVQITRELMPYGSVLIVDDVETNIYVARGLLSPYGLKIDSADSGYVAIEKIKAGKVYDIIFMDHMMPKMDGVEATQIIREMGYDQPIVALTANAVAGQADVFLGNGFDDFISKPIDVRQLNSVLNKLIRDKQPPEVIEAARQQAEDKERLAEEPRQQAIDPRFAEVFIRDAVKSLAVLDSIIKKGDIYSEEDIRTYVIHTHGIKSALANIGETGLSARALKLEKAGRNEDTGQMTSETPGFLDSLRAVIEKLAPGTDNNADEAVEDDRPLLLEKLAAVREACEAYDKKATKALVTELRDRAWSRPVKEMLDAIAESLLHSAFDEITSTVDEYMEREKPQTLQA